ncbi:Serine/arginine-rich splicing factor RS2Z32 [Zancudomyces culisetae]|uniref:Serine/arginine-rich splicing factor RS2Z32 n=1 Tax=Zancudomyces culisetae TaxID=1213189 RepID=A0A1R1PSJ2_ZANCU|nr:Serine/arginine-rich splicing factor RS2Z32 [Zancudomyces culisetae]|eukprot:OMH83852.1 Serine/arginine-rich splicing factor RS2Z32 [Zancudomyces culisetae]
MSSSNSSRAQLFVGRLPRDIRVSELEEIFGYGFVEYEDRRDAEDAIKYCDRKSLDGERIVVEFAKGSARRTDDNQCFACGREGHWARDCPTRRKRSRSRSRGRSRSPYRRGRREDQIQGQGQDLPRDRVPDHTPDLGRYRPGDIHDPDHEQGQEQGQRREGWAHDKLDQ